MLGCGSLSPSICKLAATRTQNKKHQSYEFTEDKYITNFYYFDPDDTAFVDNFLNDSAIFTDHLAHQTARHLNRFFAVLEHRPGTAHRLVRFAVNFERARVLLQINVDDTVQFSGRLYVGTVRTDRQSHQIVFDTKLVRITDVEKKECFQMVFQNKQNPLN